MKSRATELADAIEAALAKEPRGRGTKIDIQPDDWEIVVAGLRGRLDATRTRALEEQLECLRLVLAILAGKLELPDGKLVELLNEALVQVRAAESALDRPLH